MGVRRDYYMRAGLRPFTVRVPERTVEMLDLLAKSLWPRATRSDVIEAAVDRWAKQKRVALPEEYDEMAEKVG